MKAEIAQAVALTIAGNDFLRGQPWKDFWPTGTVFTHCKQVTFVALSGPTTAPTESQFAADPAQWLENLQSQGALGLRLHHVAGNHPRLSDREAVGFVGGGGRWIIEAVGNRLSDLWEARWSVGDQNDPERKIWNVTYYRVGKDRVPTQITAFELPALRNRLGEVLETIEQFALRQKLEAFAKMFRRGIEVLHSDTPLAGLYHADLAQGARLPLEARQLLGAAQAAWVFGGMGSWNDLGFEGRDQSEYTALSDQLFSLLNESVCAAANSGSETSPLPPLRP